MVTKSANVDHGRFGIGLSNLVFSPKFSLDAYNKEGYKSLVESIPSYESVRTWYDQLLYYCIICGASCKPDKLDKFLKIKMFVSIYHSVVGDLKNRKNWDPILIQYDGI